MRFVAAPGVGRGFGVCSLAHPTECEGGHNASSTRNPRGLRILGHGVGGHAGVRPRRRRRRRTRRWWLWWWTRRIWWGRIRRIRRRRIRRFPRRIRRFPRRMRWDGWCPDVRRAWDELWRRSWLCRAWDELWRRSWLCCAWDEL